MIPRLRRGYGLVLGPLAAVTVQACRARRLAMLDPVPLKRGWDQCPLLLSTLASASVRWVWLWAPAAAQQAGLRCYSALARAGRTVTLVGRGATPALAGARRWKAGWFISTAPDLVGACTAGPEAAAVAMAALLR